MTHRRPVLTVALLVIGLGLAACSSKSTKSSSAAKTTAAGETPAATAPTVSNSTSEPSSGTTTTAPVSAQPATKVAGGGATDFCTAFKEFKTAVQADTPQAKGAGFRAAAADLRKYAPAEIKAAATAYADVMDEVGKAIQSGRPGPEVLGSGQSAERRQGLADSIAWVTKNCQP